MKKFFAEFKKFITRGNVVDMAVGVIVGGAFAGSKDSRISFSIPATPASSEHPITGD